MELEDCSIRALSLRIGVDRKSIRLWLKGHYYPKYDALIKLSFYFKVRIDYLVGLEDALEEGRPTICNIPSIEEVQKHFSEKLSAFMCEKHFSRYKVAKEIGIDLKSMTKWLTSGSMPEVAKLMKLSQLMNCPIQRMLGIE